MELRNINRKYNKFKFYFKSNYNPDEYQRMADNGQYEKMKSIFIPYCEKKLHLLFSYKTFTEKLSIPIGLLMLIFITNTPILVFNTIFLIFLNISHHILDKNLKLMKQIYSFEITAINDFLSERYNTKIDNDFDELGEIYLSTIQ